MKTKEREEHWVPISLIEGEGFLTKADPVEGINSRTGGPHAVYEIHCELELHKDLRCSLNGEHWHSELFHSFQIQFLTACNHISEALQVLKITFLQNIISVSIISLNVTRRNPKSTWNVLHIAERWIQGDTKCKTCKMRFDFDTYLIW